MKILDWLGPMCLSETEVLAIPPDVPGVYLLQAFVPRLAAYPVFYAGQSNDLRRRLLEHLDNEMAKSSIRKMRQSRLAYFSAAPVSNEDLRFCIESGLIRFLRPICNTQVPHILPVLVNLPPMRLKFEKKGY